MLFSKKEKLVISDNFIKKDLLSDGKPVVKINIHAPTLKSAAKRDMLLKHAAPFYDSIFKTFASYAETELYEAAKKACTNQEDLKPYAAVMNWELTYLSANYLSVYIDISVTDGFEGDRRRRTQVWNRSNGQRCVLSDFLTENSKDYIKNAVCGTDVNRFNSDLFVLRDDAIEFFISSENGGYKAVAVTYSSLAENGYLINNEF